MPAPGTAYSAFISYSHAVDGALAPALQRGLHTFARPWSRLRALRVFLDRANLSANPGLWSAIELALKNSDYLILLASPDSAASTWVDKELDYWRHHKSPSTVLIVLTDGTIGWDSAAADFDWTTTTAIPRSAQALFHEEPMYIDLSWARSEQHVSLRNPLFRESIAQVAAPLHGREKDELISEDLGRRRRLLRILSLIVLLLLTLTISSVTLASVAQDQRKQAVTERNIAISRQTASQAELERGSRIDRSLLLGLEASRVEASVEAKRALAGSLEQTPELVGLLHGEGPTSSVVFGADGASLVSSQGSEAIVWDLASHKPLAKLVAEAEGGRVQALVLSPDGATLAFTREKGGVELWDLVNRKRRAVLDTRGGPARDLAFSSDGRGIAAVTDHSLLLWNTTGGEVAQALAAQDDGSFLSVAFSPDRQSLVTGSENGILRFWNAGTLRPLGEPVDLEGGDYIQSVTVLAFNEKGSILAWGGEGSGLIGLLSMPDRRELGSLEGHLEQVTALGFGRLDTLVSGSMDGTLRSWDVEGRRQIDSTLPGHGVVKDVAFSLRGDLFASASDQGVTALWSREQTTRLGYSAFEESSDLSISVDSVAFNSSSTMLAAASSGSLNLWNVTGRRREEPLVAEGFDETIRSLSFSPREDDVLAAGGTGGVTVWDVRARRKRAGPVAVGATVRAVGFNSDGTSLAALTEGDDVAILDVATGAQLGNPIHAGAESAAIAFSPNDPLLLAVGSKDGVSLWSTQSRRVEGTLRIPDQVAVLSIAFTADGRTLIGGDAEGTIWLWDVRTGRPIEKLVHGPGQAVTGLAVNAAGMLASVGGRQVIVWDINSRQQIVKPLAGIRDSVETITFSPDGRTLAWGSISFRPGDLLMLWDADPVSWRHRACTLAGRNLGRDEWRRIMPGNRSYHRTCNEFGDGFG